MLDVPHADVEFLKILKRHFGFHGLGLVGSSLVGLLGVGEFLQLLFDNIVFQFLKEQLGFGKLVSGLQQVGGSQSAPVETFHVDKLAQFLRRERQEWFESDGEVGHELKTDVENGLYALGIGLPHFPRFTLGDVFVADAGEIHGLFLRFAELECVEIALHLLLYILKFVDGLLVHL